MNLKEYWDGLPKWAKITLPVALVAVIGLAIYKMNQGTPTAAPSLDSSTGFGEVPAGAYSGPGAFDMALGSSADAMGSGYFDQIAEKFDVINSQIAALATDQQNFEKTVNEHLAADHVDLSHSNVITDIQKSDTAPGANQPDPTKKPDQTSGNVVVKKTNSIVSPNATKGAAGDKTTGQAAATGSAQKPIQKTGPTTATGTQIKAPATPAKPAAPVSTSKPATPAKPAATVRPVSERGVDTGKVMGPPVPPNNPAAIRITPTPAKPKTPTPAPTTPAPRVTPAPTVKPVIKAPTPSPTPARPKPTNTIAPQKILFPA